MNLRRVDVLKLQGEKKGTAQEKSLTREKRKKIKEIKRHKRGDTIKNGRPKRREGTSKQKSKLRGSDSTSEEIEEKKRGPQGSRAENGHWKIGREKAARSPIRGETLCEAIVQ